ncbi:hypothetical protein JCM10213v2_008369 [Rhodosporidiobolus nylandii]
MEWTDLVSTIRKTRGEVPPALVGASVTLVGDCVYVFGGRPVASREMVNTLYQLDLRTLSWTRLDSPSTPAPRYFHSCDAWGDKLLVFGGQTFVAASEEERAGGGADDAPQGHLETLDELAVFDTTSRTWSFPPLTTRPGVKRPSPRYAHLAVVNTVSCPPPPGFPNDAPSFSSRLVIIGGQDYENNYIPDLAVLDLDRSPPEWIADAPYPRKAGTYRSVGAAAGVSVRPLEERQGMDEALVHSSYSAEPSEEDPEPVFVFSNTNFSNPRRDLDLIPSIHDQLTTPAYLSLSDLMIGEPSFPPGLRFPRAYICGRHLVVSGQHIGLNRGEAVCWALDLGSRRPNGQLPGEKLAWSRLPVDKVLGSGSWGPTVGWRNTLVALGDPKRDMMSDYNSRANTYSTVAFVDLEGFGIYVPPPQPLAPAQQSLGLLTLSQPQLCDYELLCSDKERLGCSRKLLEARWQWFANEIAAVEAKAASAVEAREQRTATGSGAYDDSSDDEPIDTMQRMTSPTLRSAAKLSHAGPARAPSRLFPLTSRTLELPLPSQEVKALLQFFHALALSTPLQRSLPVLTSLLAFTKAHDGVLPALRALVIHALHESLTPETAAKVYEAASLGGAVPLQVRATVVMLEARRPSAPQQYALPQESMTSSRHSAQSSDSHSSLPYDHSPASSQPSTPATSTCSSYSHPPRTPLPPAPSSIPPLPPIPPAFTSAPLSAPLPSQPVFPGPPLVEAAPRTSTTLGRSSSFGAASDVSLAPSSQSGHSTPPIPNYAAPPRSASSSTSSSTMPIATSTPARIAEAWREGEERDRRQRAEAARLQAEAGDVNRGLFGLRIGDRKGSITPSMDSIPEQDANNTHAYGATASISGLTFPADDGDSIRTSSSSGGNSTATRQSAEKAAAAAATAATVTAKVVKKGFLGGLLAQPTMHNGGTKGAPAAVGPPPRRSYPAPRTRKEVEEMKKAAKKASSSGSSVRS